MQLRPCNFEGRAQTETHTTSACAEAKRSECFAGLKALQDCREAPSDEEFQKVLDGRREGASMRSLADRRRKIFGRVQLCLARR